MKEYLIGLILIAGLNACNDSSSDAELKDPSTVHPPSETIPDSTRLVNDSVIVPDIKVDNDRQIGKSDSIQKTKQ
jgi:hypothetical protein